MATAKSMVTKLHKAKDAYYNGSPTMSDAEFDKLEDELRAIDPDNDYFKVVGAPTGNTKTKVKHRIPMLSCGKAKEVSDVMSWLGKVATDKTELIVQPKIDGLSAACIYEGGKLKMVCTRGDGKVGQDITHIAQFVNIPQTITNVSRTEIRGELYIPKDSTVPNSDNSPLRNIAVGFVNRKGGKHSLEDLRFVHFVAYHYITEFPFIASMENEMEHLRMDGFEVVEYKLLKGENAIALYRQQYLDTIRDAWNYETDGLVLTVNDRKKWDTINTKYEVSHHNHYNIALKPPSEGKETTLLEIDWQVSRQGKLVPVAIVAPVTMGGATIRRATLNNLDNVKKLKLHEGDTVLIERANDVIPFFAKNLTAHAEHSKKLLPGLCPSCDGDLVEDGIHLACKNSKCREQNIKTIVHWVKNCNMEQFSEASVRALFDAKKIATMKDLYELEADDFAGVEGFGKSKTANALAQIQATKEMTIGEFVDRLGIDLVGEKAMKKLGITTVAGLLNHKDRQYRIGENLMDYVNDNRTFIEQLLECVTITKTVIQTVKAGSKMVCMTGTGPKKRDELIADIQAKGDVFIDRVTKETNVLVCADPKAGTTKLAKAEKMGVELVSYEEYFA